MTNGPLTNRDRRRNTTVTFLAPPERLGPRIRIPPPHEPQNSDARPVPEPRARPARVQPPRAGACAGRSGAAPREAALCRHLLVPPPRILRSPPPPAVTAHRPRPAQYEPRRPAPSP